MPAQPGVITPAALHGSSPFLLQAVRPCRRPKFCSYGWHTATVRRRQRRDPRCHPPWRSTAMQCLAEFCGDDGKPPRRCRPPTGRPALCRERCPKGEQQRARGPAPPLPFDGTPPSRDRNRVTHGENDASTEKLAPTVLELWRRHWTRSTIWLKIPGTAQRML
jgi:hypothetical protein